MTMPSVVLENVNILGAAVPRELVESCTRRHDNRAITVGESFGRSVVSERSNIAACDQRSCRLDSGVMFFEDSAGVVLVAIEVKVDRCVATVFLLAGNRCSCGHRLVSLLRWFVVVGFDDGDTIVGHRQHEGAAVVPIDIDLRPVAVFVDFNDGPQRSNGDWIWILRHRYQTDAIAFLQSCLHSHGFLVSFGGCVEFVEQFAGLSQACVDLGHRVNVPPAQCWVVWWLQGVERLTQSIKVITCNEMKVLVGSCRLKGWFGHGWFLVVGETKDDPQQSASESQKHQANMRACFAKFLETCGCAGEPQFRDVSRCVAGGAYVRINEKTPTRCKRGAIGGKRSVLRACLQVVRYQDGSAVAGDGNRISASGSGEQRGTLADHVHHAADVELAIVNRSQVVGDAWLWHCDLAFGQVIHRSQIVKVFHRLGLLASNGEASAFGLHELAIVALGQVAKDRAVQGRVGSLATGAGPIALGFHRGDQLLSVHRFARFAENLQGRSDAAQSLLAGVGRLGGCSLCLAWLLENRNRCGSIAPDRFDRCGLVLNHRYVAFSGDLRASAFRTHFSLQALGALDQNLLTGREVGCVPAASRLLGIDPNLAAIARNVRVVLAADLYFCLLHLRISKSMFVVGCHRQADRTTDRLRASVLRFGLLTKDQVRQSLAEKVDYHLDLRIDRRHIQATVEVEHHFAVGQALNPKLRNLALVQFVRFVFCVFGEDQSIESVFVVDLALHPRPASTAVAIADLGDRQVEVVLGHLLVSVFWLVNRFRVNTHEPCGLNRIKPDSKGIRILFFGAYLRSEMLGELRCGSLHISQFVEELFHGRLVGNGEDRHLFDRCVQVADCFQRSPVRSEELGRGQAGSVGHGWHRVSPVLGWFETAFGMHTHEPCGLNGIKPISAAFSSLLRCFFESPSLAHVRICRVRLHVASLGVSGRKNATRCECRVVFATQRRESIRGVLGFCLTFLADDLEHLLDPLHRDSKVSQFDSLLVVKLEVVREGIGERSEVLLEQGELLVDLCVVVGVGVVLLMCVTGHRGFPLGFESEIAYAMTHMSHAVQTASSRRGKDSEGFSESFPRRIGVSQSTVATRFPGSFAAVADLAAFDDVDDVLVGDVLVVVALVIVVRFVHVAAAGHAADAVLERPVLLSHQPHFGVASELFAVVVEDFDQGVEIHVWFSVWVNENWLCDNTHEPCGSGNLKPSLQCFQQVFSAFFGRQTFVNRFGQHAAGKGIHGFFEHAEFCFQGAGRISARYHERACQVVGQSLQPCDHFAIVVADIQRGSARHLFEGGSDCSVSGVGSGHRFVLLLRSESGWSLGDDTHEPCGSTGSKPISAAFSHVLPCFSGGLTGPNVGPCCDVLNVGSLVEGAHKNATVGECRDQAEEHRASVRGVRGIPPVCGLEDLSEAAVLHRVQGLDSVEVFGEKRAGAGRLLCVGDLEGFRQGHQTLDRLVVGFADLLGLVGVHRLEDLAKGCVRSCVWVVCVGHVCVSVSEKGLNRLRDDTHEPCGLRKLKPNIQRLRQNSECFSNPPRSAQNAHSCVAFAHWPLLVTYTKHAHSDETWGTVLKTKRNRTSVFGNAVRVGLVVGELGIGIRRPLLKNDYRQRAFAQNIQGLLSEVQFFLNRGCGFTSHSASLALKRFNQAGQRSAGVVERREYVACASWLHIGQGGLDGSEPVVVEIHLCLLREGFGNCLPFGDNTHEPCGCMNIKPSRKTFQKDSAGGAEPPANPRRSLILSQEELEHGPLLVEELELGFCLARVSQVAFSEVHPAHAARLVGHHGFHVLDRSFGSSEHRLGMLVEAALRVGDHPSEASQFVLDRLFGASGGCVVHLCFSVSEGEWNRLRDDTHEPCGLNNLKPNPAAFLNVFPCFSACPTVANVGPRRVRSHVGYSVECCCKNATVRKRRDQTKVGRDSVRGHRLPDRLVQRLVRHDFWQATLVKIGHQVLDSLVLLEKEPFALAVENRGSECEMLSKLVQLVPNRVKCFANTRCGIWFVGVELSKNAFDGFVVFVLLCCGHLYGSWYLLVNRLRDDTHEPCGLNNLKSIPVAFLNVLPCFSGSLTGPDVGPCCDVSHVGYLVEGAKKDATVGECRDQTKERRDSVRGVLCGCGLGRAVVFAGELEEFGFDLLPFRFRFAGDLSVDLIAKGTLVPTFGPSESVEQSVEFGLAQAGTRSIPAALGAFLFDVVPFAAAFGIEGEFNQTQNHHQVSDHLGLVERSAEGSEFDSVLAAGQVGQVQQVVAIRFASALGVVFVAVLFDPLGVHHLFAFAGSGRSVDRSLVVADQGDQSCQGGCVSDRAERWRDREVARTAVGELAGPG